MSTGFSIPPLPKVGRWDVRDRRMNGDGMLARLANEAPRKPWETFLREDLHWRYGEHMALIGPTGQGKTTLLNQILDVHKYVVVFATKPRDASMDRLIARGYDKMTRWDAVPPERSPKRVLWPDARRMNSKTVQQEVFRDAFDRIYREGGWTVALDELWYIINKLNLDDEVKTYLLQARSLGISLVVATQRPAWVPLEVYDQSTHLFFWRDNDETNLRRLSGISWRSGDMIRHTIANLDEFQVLYVNTRTGAMARTRAPKPATN